MFTQTIARPRDSDAGPATRDPGLPKRFERALKRQEQKMALRML